MNFGNFKNKVNYLLDTRKTHQKSINDINENIEITFRDRIHAVYEILKEYQLLKAFIDKFDKDSDKEYFDDGITSLSHGGEIEYNGHHEKFRIKTNNDWNHVTVWYDFKILDTVNLIPALTYHKELMDRRLKLAKIRLKLIDNEEMIDFLLDNVLN